MQIKTKLTTPVPQALKFISEFLSGVDTEKVAWIRFTERASTCGLCRYPHYPTKKQKKYRISCGISRNFLETIWTWQKPIYCKPENVREIIEDLPDYVRVIEVVSRGDKFWIKTQAMTIVGNADESAVWIFGHEVYHFLRHSRQLRGISPELGAKYRNVEWMADAYGDSLLKEYRKWLTK